MTHKDERNNTELQNTPDIKPGYDYIWGSDQDEFRQKPAQKVKVVAEMPEDEEMREQLEEFKKNDGYPGSCGQ
ncbi:MULTISPECIES: hypothetical protein [unclassified Paenibacillus]|uniref:hypothetical protein n=1 Tax=unclassified Paenibacillus TaxID=185978 RepID=UPI001C101B5A|nr:MULTISPECIES: hypothetical protein [unclassified Paenibacillus]MBU5442227.1 hypothetical protein [Paenibacillus sp. MSJ-34]CAH0118971.1 hypothetical protein PAE9249_01468 [Paenibacillus sp. CECT 9249]